MYCWKKTSLWDLQRQFRLQGGGEEAQLLCNMQTDNAAAAVLPGASGQALRAAAGLSLQAEVLAPWSQETCQP